MTNLVTIMKAISSLAAIVDAMRPNLATIYAQYMYHRFLGVVLESTKRRIIAPFTMERIAAKNEPETMTMIHILQPTTKNSTKRPLSSLNDLLPVSPKAGNGKSKSKGESKKGRFQPY